jgi:hypothetical protein
MGLTIKKNFSHFLAQTVIFRKTQRRSHLEFDPKFEFF